MTPYGVMMPVCSAMSERAGMMMYTPDTLEYR